MPENLWPTDFGEVAQKTPVAILREQANALGDRTANIVVGKVSMSPQTFNGGFVYEFDLYSAPLGYSEGLLTITHGIELYPVRIRPLDGGDDVVATTPDEFAARLKDLFSREKTKKTIASLIAQSKE
jgi:hypothetical protein